MTNPDFDEWLAFHFSRFTACAGWLAKFPVTPRHLGDPTQRTVIDGWRETMRPVELKHAKTASQLLAVGEESFPDKGYDCHPSTVRRIAMRHAGAEKQDRKQRIVDGEPVYDCGVCSDSGLVIVWHPTALKFFKEHFEQEPPEEWMFWWTDTRWRDKRLCGQVYESCVVLCSCAVGMAKKIKATHYDKNKHVLFDNDPQSALEAFSNTPDGGWGLGDEF